MTASKRGRTAVLDKDMGFVPTGDAPACWSKERGSKSGGVVIGGKSRTVKVGGLKGVIGVTIRIVYRGFTLPAKSFPSWQWEIRAAGFEKWLNKLDFGSGRNGSDLVRTLDVLTTSAKEVVGL